VDRLIAQAACYGETAPRGALLYSRQSREGLGGLFLNRMANRSPKGQ